jgi:hypothetical protein
LLVGVLMVIRVFDSQHVLVRMDSRKVTSVTEIKQIAFCAAPADPNNRFFILGYRISAFTTVTIIV